MNETVKSLAKITYSDISLKKHKSKIRIPKEEISANSTRMDLTAVAQAAAAGVAATNCTKLVNDLLSKVNIPPIIDGSLPPKTLQHPLIEECIESDVLAIADLSFTSTIDLDVCNHLMNLASEKIPFKSIKNKSEIVGFVVFFQQMNDVIQQTTAIASETKKADDAKSLSGILTQSVSPLVGSKLAQHVGLWRKMSQILAEFMILLNYTDEASDMKPSLDQNSQNPNPRLFYKKLTYACSVSDGNHFLPLPYNSENTVNYLVGMYDYLRQLTSVLKECSKEPRGNVSV